MTANNIIKRVNITEAIKANEHSRVRIVGDEEWRNVGYFKYVECMGMRNILAEWEIEEKPFEVWCNIYPEGIEHAIVYRTKEEADLNASMDRIRCIKMIEDQGEE